MSQLLKLTEDLKYIEYHISSNECGVSTKCVRLIRGN